MLLKCRHPQFTPRRVNTFVDAVQQTGGIQADGLGIWGFVDGHFVGFARAQGVERQRAFYSGHKKADGMNFQAIGTPDGLVSPLIGPFPGPVNDWAMWKCSGCDERLRSLQQQTGDSRRFYIYSDYAFCFVFRVIWPMPEAVDTCPMTRSGLMQRWHHAALLLKTPLDISIGTGHISLLQKGFVVAIS